MNIWKQFIFSFYKIKVLAAFRVMKINKAIGYTFFLALFVLIIVLITTGFSTGENQLLYQEAQALDISPVIVSLVSIPYIYLMITGGLFIYISLLAAIGLIIIKYLKKKLVYKQIWVITAYAITAPTLIFTLIDAVSQANQLAGWFYILLSLFYIGAALRKVPPLQQRKHDK